VILERLRAGHAVRVVQPEFAGVRARWGFPPVRLALLVASAWAVACRGEGSVLDPAGPRAARISDLAWLMTAIGIAVYVLVLAALLIAIVRRRREAPLVRDSVVIVGGGVVLPLLVLPALWVATLLPMRDLAVRAEPAVTIEVIGHQWWYEVRYPDRGIVLRDEMRVPAGQGVLLRLTSADVIHSFWAPRLAGKMDMIPGRTTELWIEASRPGTYLVQCSEFCGLWHARMRMEIVAETPEAFARWLEQARSAP
jgi:cytochrome c oxidase subunit II